MTYNRNCCSLRKEMAHTPGAVPSVVLPDSNDTADWVAVLRYLDTIANKITSLSKTVSSMEKRMTSIENSQCILHRMESAMNLLVKLKDGPAFLPFETLEEFENFCNANAEIHNELRLFLKCNEYSERESADFARDAFHDVFGEKSDPFILKFVWKNEYKDKHQEPKKILSKSVFGEILLEAGKSYNFRKEDSSTVASLKFKQFKDALHKMENKRLATQGRERERLQQEVAERVEEEDNGGEQF